MAEYLTYASLRGNWATLLLATDRDGSLNYSKMSDEIDALISSRPDGIYSNGTACEFYSQNIDEFYRISELLASKCRKAGVKFQIGVSHPCAEESVERLKAVTGLSPWAVQVILPDWFPVDDRAAVSFLTRMSDIGKEIPLVLYNPPHAKRVLFPAEWQMLKKAVPTLIGIKVFDNNCSAEWYEDMRNNSEGLSVFVPGHHLATGIMHGAAGSYSNVACLAPKASQAWYRMMREDIVSALALEKDLRRFFETYIDPLIAGEGYANFVIDKFLAVVGGYLPGFARTFQSQYSAYLYAEPLGGRARRYYGRYFNV